MSSHEANNTIVSLAPDSDPALAARLRDVPGVEVVWPAPQTAFVSEGSVQGLAWARLVLLDEIDEIVLLSANSPRTSLAVIRGVLDDATAARLEDASVAYVDAANRVWFPGLHKTRRARSVKPRRRGLRPEGVGLLQLLADHPDTDWSERALAKRGNTSAVTAHRLLNRLEQEQLVRRSQGTHRRRVSDIAKLRRWLLDNAGRRGGTERLLCFIPDEKREAAAHHALLALTGAGAASEYGLPVLTAVPRITYRVDTSGRPLDEIPKTLGGFRTDQGANTVLIADPSRLAFLDVRRREGLQLAPPSRVLLDLQFDPRGDAAAALFLDLWGAKELT